MNAGFIGVEQALEKAQIDKNQRGEKLSLKDIRIIAILLSCSPLQCFTRAISRYSENQKNIRNISEIIDHKEESIKLFEKCEENKQILIHQNCS